MQSSKLTSVFTSFLYDLENRTSASITLLYFKKKVQLNFLYLHSKTVYAKINPIYFLIFCKTCLHLNLTEHPGMNHLLFLVLSRQLS